ncbi:MULTISPECIES: hypothetical protein [Amycolatopsis]|uniref:Uncharacterized protein n=1 Tax=Amycolatopsis albidoflavus TaxID=102226 RepID=A0ABW5I198_9PSEU
MEFVVAEDEVWFSVFDVLPRTEEATGDDFVREVRIPVSETEELHLSWDATHRSVRFRHRRESDIVVDVYREHATLLTIEVRDTGPVVVAEYHANGFRGRTAVRFRPTFALTDVLLQT